MMRSVFFFFLAVMLPVNASPTHADIVDWQIDPVQSFARLTINDQDITFEGTTLTVRLRNANSTTTWTDGGGRRANLQGTLRTNYSESGQTLAFVQGGQDIRAIETVGTIAGQFRPNPAVWDGTDYTANSGAPAAFGARVRGTAAVLFNFDLGFLALRQVSFAADGLSSLSGTNGNFTANTPTAFLFGTSASVDFDGFLVSILGQQIDVPNIRGALAESALTNVTTGDLTIENLGGLQRRLTQNVTINVALPVADGIIVNGTITKRIVAVASIPEPASSSLISAAILFGVFQRRRSRD